MTKVEIFTSPTCPYCPHAVKLAKDLLKEGYDFKLVETSTGTYEGQERAKSLDVRSVPTLFITGSETQERIGYVGVPSKQSFIKMINIAEGKEKWPEQEKKESFISKIFNKFK
ncbi:MAG: glutaredoxin domain-containing protein [Candidatus Woesearchaeota archaeon]